VTSYRSVVGAFVRPGAKRSHRPDNPQTLQGPLFMVHFLFCYTYWQ